MSGVSEIKVIILDFDGVLVESVGIKDEAFRALFKHETAHLDEIMAYHLANNATIRYEKFRHITEHILKRPYSQEVEKSLCDQFSRLIIDKIVQCPYVEGAVAFLEFFCARVPAYVVSVNPREELERIIEARGLAAFFRRVYADPWKKTDAIRDILDHERVAQDQVVYIGDTYEDYLAAREAGVFFLGRDSQRSFRDADARIFTNMREILDDLKSKMRD